MKKAKAKVRRVATRLLMLVASITAAVPVMATGDETISNLEGMMKNLISFMWLIPRGLGVWMLITGIKDLTTGINDHQNNQSLKGIMEIFGGGALLFARELVRWIVGDSTI